MGDRGKKGIETSDNSDQNIVRALNAPYKSMGTPVKIISWVLPVGNQIQSADTLF